MRKAIAACVLLAFAAPRRNWAQSHVPLGPEFQVNAYTTGDQFRPRVARMSDGGFIVAWQSFGDGSGYGIFGRLFDSSGSPQGVTDFRVNAYTTGTQRFPAIAATAEAGFVVLWDGPGDGSNGGVFGRRYDGSLVPQGGEFQVNEFTTQLQYKPAAASDSAGGFVVAWAGQSSLGSYEISARRYDGAGTALGGDIAINSHVSGFQIGPVVAADAAGNFVVVWTGDGPGGTSWDVLGRRYDATGAPLGGAFMVNTYTTGTQQVADVVSDPEGNFVVVWLSSDGSGLYGVWARRYDPGGAPKGAPFLVNQYTTDTQTLAAARMDATGGFVVVWTSGGQDGEDQGIFGRAFDASGTPLGGEFAVNTYTTDNQNDPSVAVAPSGKSFVVVWTSDRGGRTDVFGRRFLANAIFKDGFESGSLAAWSASANDGGDLAVSGLAAMKLSAFGLRALVDDTAGLYVQDDTPEDEDHYRARFYFDLNGFDPGEAQAHRRTRIFLAFEDGPRRVAALVLRRLNGAYSLMARARQDDNSQANTPFIPITDGPHVVEFEWRRSSGPDALDGSLELWIDGVSVATLSGLDNSISAVDFVRLGALSVKAGASGSMYWDEFESRRVTYIGP